MVKNIFLNDDLPDDDPSGWKRLFFKNIFFTICIYYIL